MPQRLSSADGSLQTTQDSCMIHDLNVSQSHMPPTPVLKAHMSTWVLSCSQGDTPLCTIVLLMVPQLLQQRRGFICTTRRCSVAVPEQQASGVPCSEPECQPIILVSCFTTKLPQRAGRALLQRGYELRSSVIAGGDPLDNCLGKSFSTLSVNPKPVVPQLTSKCPSHSWHRPDFMSRGCCWGGMKSTPTPFCPPPPLPPPHQTTHIHNNNNNNNNNHLHRSSFPLLFESPRREVVRSSPNVWFLTSNPL